MVLPKGKCQPLNFGKLKGKHEMKYQLNDGRIMTEDELKALYCSMHPYHNKDIEFGFWLYFAVERGTIKEVRE
jgi:hypothetical protein